MSIHDRDEDPERVFLWSEEEELSDDMWESYGRKLVSGTHDNEEETDSPDVY